MNGKPEKNRMITPKGEPLEDTGGVDFQVEVEVRVSLIEDQEDLDS
jgi:hypothetical protein